MGFIWISNSTKPKVHYSVGHFFHSDFPQIFIKGWMLPELAYCLYIIRISNFAGESELRALALAMIRNSLKPQQNGHATGDHLDNIPHVFTVLGASVICAIFFNYWNIFEHALKQLYLSLSKYTLIIFTGWPSQEENLSHAVVVISRWIITHRYLVHGIC